MKYRQFVSVFLILLFAGSVLPVFAAQQSQLPLRVRLVLARVAPLQTKGELLEVESQLTNFTMKAEARKDETANHPAINFALGNCYLLQKKHSKAIAAYRRVLESDPQHISAWQNLASCQYQTKRYATASYSYRQAYDLSSPANPEFLYYSASAAVLDDQPQQAIDLFKLLIQKHPNSIKLQWREALVHALLAINDSRQALSHIELLASGYTGKKQQRWQEILLYQYLELNMQESALTLAERLSHKDPTNPRWWKGLTHIHLLSDHYTQALASLTIYSLVTPLTAEEQKLLADLYLQEGIPVKAAVLYEEYLSSHLKKNTIERLVQAYRQQGQSDQALQLLMRINDESDEFNLDPLHAELLYELHQYAEAADLFEQVAKEQKTGRAWLMAGYCHWRMDSYQKAHQAFSNAAKNKKQHKEAKRAMALLNEHQMAQ